MFGSWSTARSALKLSVPDCTRSMPYSSSHTARKVVPEYAAPAFALCCTSNGFVTPKLASFAGMICMRPCAPAELTALGL